MVCNAYRRSTMTQKKNNPYSKPLPPSVKLLEEKRAEFEAQGFEPTEEWLRAYEKTKRILVMIEENNNEGLEQTLSELL